MEINPTKTSIAALALEVPNALRALEELQIDFCSYGQQTIADACDTAGIAVEDLFAAIGGDLTLENARDWQHEPMSSLQEHLVSDHHSFTRHALETVTLLAARVAERHGLNHPEVLRVRALVASLEEQLLDHMLVEERVVFPYLHQLESHAQQSASLVQPSETVSAALRAMAADHEAAASCLLEIRRETDDYTLPDDACLSYRALYERLSDLEIHLGEHMRLENAFIFSRAPLHQESAGPAAG